MNWSVTLYECEILGNFIDKLLLWIMLIKSLVLKKNKSLRRPIIPYHWNQYLHKKPFFKWILPERQSTRKTSTLISQPNMLTACDAKLLSHVDINNTVLILSYHYASNLHVVIPLKLGASTQNRLNHLYNVWWICNGI
jgi:hypothetical protein